MLAEWARCQNISVYRAFGADSCIEETELFVAERMSQI
jgi:hypothetical protein